MKGTVKWFSTQKRFGFISGEDGKDVFVHEQHLMPGVVIKEGDPVEFEIVEGKKGPQADKVKISEKKK